MNIFPQFRILQKFVFAMLSIVFASSNVTAQFCLGLEIRSDEAKADEVFLDVTTKEFNGVAAMQFTILFDHRAYEFIDFVESNLLDFTSGNINVNPGGQAGALALAWFDRTGLGLTYSDEKPLVTFKLKKLKESTIPFEFSDSPTAIEVTICSPGLVTGCEVLYNFENCTTGENLVPAISGQLFLDDNKNCELETAERNNTLPSWGRWNIAASQNGEYYFSGYLRPDGSYDVKIFPGENLIEIIRPGPYYDVCEASFILHSEDIDPTTAVFESLIQIKEECPFLEVTLGSLLGNPCEETLYLLNYRNNGTAAVENAYIDLNIDYRVNLLEDQEIPLVDLGNNNYRIEIGSLDIGANNFIALKVEIPCEVTDAEMLRNEAHIYPNEVCGEIGANWSGASLKVGGTCIGDKIVFELENIGDGDMLEPLEYVVIEDAIIFRTEPVQLPKGAKTSISFDANGSTYFLQIPQERGHPGDSKPSASVEACGRNENGEFSTGYANRFPEENTDLFVSIDYQFLSTGSQAARLLASPIGFSDQHLIEPNNAIEYTLYFSNSVSGLQIVDTLSANLDLTTFLPIVADHPYEYALDQGVLTLTIPPTFPNGVFGEDNFVKFRIKPKNDLPLGTVISNSAQLVYPDDRVEESNLVFHTLGEDFVESSTSNNFLPTSNTTLTVYPNPSSELVVFTIKNWQPTEYQLSIFDVEGKLVENTAFNSQQYYFHKGELPGGTYLYRLVGEGATVENGFFVLID